MIDENIFKNKAVFIVEDDPLLSVQLKSFFQRVTDIVPDYAGSNQDAIEIIKNNNKIFDLAVIDIMLPDTRDQKDNNYKLYDRWKEIEKYIEELKQSNQADKDEIIEKCKYAKDLLQEEIRKNINLEAGFELVKDWCTDYSDSFQNTLIMFLTAREDPELKDNMKQLFGTKEFVWLTKPVTTTEILVGWSKLLGKK